MSPAALSRRHFLAGLAGGSLVFAAQLSARPLVARVLGGAHGVAALAFEPDLFLAIEPDGVVRILAHRSEMGTGIRTALPMVVADELGADWARVVIEQADGDARLGSQNTDGSRSVRRFFERMRVAGATARHMLEQAAAARWKVPAARLKTHDHAVHDPETGSSLGFAELLEDAAALPVPAPDALTMKPRSEWKLVGTDVPLTDLDGLVRGTAVFGLDLRRAGQLYAVIARPPVLGGRAVSWNADAVKQLPGVVDVVELAPFTPPHGFQPLGGIAVLADSTWHALQGRERLAVEWQEGAHAGFDSQQLEGALRDAARRPGKAWREVGDVDAAFAAADALHEADYYVPLLAHASMEPPCALAEVQVDGDGAVTSCEVWAPTQNPQAAQQTLGAVLGIEPEAAVVHVSLLGGGFGRKSKPDYVAEAALLAKATGRPVHVTWTREDDIRHDYYHTVGAVHMKAAHDDRGMPSAWLQRSSFPPITSTFVEGATEGSAGELSLGFTDVPYAAPNLRVENAPAPAPAHVRIGWLRSVAHIYHAFAVCSFPDELARKAGRDPFEHLLELLGEDRLLDLDGVDYPNHGEPLDRYPFDVGRLRRVTERVAALAEWGRALPRGRGLGIACHRSFLSYHANVVEVAIDRDGTLRIPQVWSVVDAGTVVNPDRVHAQLEGAAVFGASLALQGEITAEEGRIVQSNFDTYPVARLTDAPQRVVTEIVASEALPGGVGEVGVPAFAPALCNAIDAAIGKRVRRLPLSKHDLSWS